MTACGPGVPGVDAPLPEVVDFNLHVKPILSDRCFACHGPDAGAREAGLRLDTPEGAFAALQEGKGHALVPGSLRRSEVFRRITSQDPAYRMPPPESGLALTPYEVALLAQWIEQGAVYQPHWAFLPPRRPVLPVTSLDWGTNEIDRFVLARLEREGLTPAPEADRATLLRRVTLDLTGLPPTLAALDAFLADTTAGAYERAVERLLAAPSYGEHMAAAWMDLARFADSHGYHADGYRRMWPWRDWVIHAFNDNLPYDQFLTWQLAGDLLPGATRDQVLATGFHRNHPINSESGIVEEEYRLENVFDRVNTTGRAFLGLTVECARCHDHKYDPVSQRDYYRLAAFFNNVDELGLIPNDGNTGPLLLLPDEEAERRIEALQREIRQQEAALRSYAAAAPALPVAQPTLPPGLVAHLAMDRIRSERLPNAVAGRPAGEVKGTIEVVPGRVGAAVRLPGTDYDRIELPETGLFERYEPFSIGLWIRPDAVEVAPTLVSNKGGKNSSWRGLELFLDSTYHVAFRLIHAPPHNLLHVVTEAAVPVGAWTHVLVTYDGSSRADGVSLYLDGQKARLQVRQDRLYKSIHPASDARIPLRDGQHRHPEDRPLRLGRSVGDETQGTGPYAGLLDDLRVYDRQLTPVEAALLAGAPLPDDAAAWRQYRLHRQDAHFQQRLAALQRVRAEAHAVVEDVHEVMVMEERATPRATYVLDRGAYDAPGERVTPGTPAALPPLPEDAPADRLGLARWLTGPAHPLTARVAVNRYWQQFFGRGLVATPEDFGSQGAVPSHPALLDYLAVTFVESGWDVKAMQKRIVMSATYRQAPYRPGDSLRRRDPDNRLLARGPRHRLTAEQVRDQALAASGLLVRQVGGRSVRPYQPPGLWSEKASFSPTLLHYVPDSTDGLYRRSLYTFIRRTSPPPSMLMFDAPDRTECIVRRQRTATPLQALVLMNDPQYVEAARILAERTLREGGATLDDRLAYVFRLLTSRPPHSEETAVLRTLYASEQAAFATSPEQALELLKTGARPRDPAFDPAEVAALAVVASTVMNHDKAINN